MIRLRELEKKDAPYMLEWMHDPEVQKGFRKNMLSMTLSDAEAFCEKASIPEKLVNGSSVHFAIVDDNDDEYLGTISLKNIDLNSRHAEYAISTRKKAHGKGIAKCATGLLLKKAFNEYDLNRVYLSVLADNSVAIRFYEKCGFIPEGVARNHLKINDEYVSLKLYGLLKEEYTL